MKKEEKMKKLEKPKIKSLSDLAKTEDAKSRLRQFFAIMLQADKARLNALLDKEKSQSQK